MESVARGASVTYVAQGLKTDTSEEVFDRVQDDMADALTQTADAPKDVLSLGDVNSAQVGVEAFFRR